MSGKKQHRPRRTYTPEFKKQLVDLYRSGKRKCDVVREYDIANFLLDKWIAQADNSGYFNEKDNRTPEQQELIELHKQNQQLKMEERYFTPKAGYAKQAALIFRTKVNGIKANAHKYSVSAMCKVLKISRSTYYYEAGRACINVYNSSVSSTKGYLQRVKNCKCCKLRIR